jgi:hypothetical protein
MYAISNTKYHLPDMDGDETHFSHPQCPNADLFGASPGPRTFVRINDLATPPEPADGLQGDATYPPVNDHRPFWVRGLVSNKIWPFFEVYVNWGEGNFFLW